MPSDTSIIACIDSQIASNRGKNLYHTGRERTIAFTRASRELVGHRSALRAIVEGGKADGLIDFTVQRALREFYHTNQYFDPETSHIAELRGVYRHTLADALSGALGADTIASRHYGRLADWLAETSPITRRIYAPEEPMVESVVCAEYSPALQLGILGIDLPDIIEPVMDVGCGEHANLVTYLRSAGIEAYGVDRLVPRGRGHLFAGNWLDVEFKPGRWGTIISNLSFSSHFINNHLRSDGRHGAYARKYVELLNALKVGGSYHYAPSIPFIEQYLPADRYAVTREKLDGDHGRTVIRKIR